MTGKVLDLFDVISPDRIAVGISEKYITWDNLRQTAKVDWEEVRRYVYATDTTQTSNSTLPWKNKTTIPKLCQIRDNLLSNYTATMFPKRKWLEYEANNKDSSSVEKRNAILNYMSWAIAQPSFKHEMDKIIMDYIDFGNCFSTVEWIDERVNQPGKMQMGYIGPAVQRISPLNIVMNPTAENFYNSPKIVRSFTSMGEIKKMLERESNDQNQEEYEKLWEYLKETRSKVRNFAGDISQQDNLYAIDGFTSFRNYLESDFVEVLTFYGDYIDNQTYEFYPNQVITVVDRHKLINQKANPSFFGYPPIFHAPWRKKQDNLWGQGPLANLVSMQYRLDHIENLRADVLDLTIYPVQMITGYVDDYRWEPGAKIFGGDEGKVELVQPDVNVLQANFDLQRYEQTMEQMAGAPREAMGFRTPGEKTKYEVQSLENAAARVFQNKIKQFEEQILEPLLNAMLELAQRNLTNAITISVFDDEFKGNTFQTLTVEDIIGIGRIKPVAARHFAEQAEWVQNISSLAQSNVWPLVQMHFSGIQLAKTFENYFNMSDMKIVVPYIGLAEQADAQKQANALEQQVAMEAMTATGMGDDYDMDRIANTVMAPPAAQTPTPVDQQMGQIQ